MPAKTYDPRLQQQIDNLKNEILDLQRMKANLRASEERFQSIFNSMKDIYFEVDLKGNLIYFNPAVCEAYGYTAEELSSMNNRQYATPEAARRMYEIFHQLYLTGEPATPPEAAARLGEFPQVAEWFARFYGRAARNYALAVLARGGLFVSGGVAGRNPALVDHPAFLEEFRSSRGHARRLAAVPVAHMADQDAGVHGAALAALHLPGDGA